MAEANNCVRVHYFPYYLLAWPVSHPQLRSAPSYERLTVVSYAGMYRNRERTYLCRCICGNMTTVPGYSLNSGNTKSCGCLRRDKAAERRTTHGQTAQLSRTPIDEGRCR